VVGESLQLVVEFITLHPDPEYPDALGFTKFERFVRLEYEPNETASLDGGLTDDEQSEPDVDDLEVDEVESVVDWFFEFNPKDQLLQLRKQIIVWKASEAGERLYEADQGIPEGANVYSGLDRHLANSALLYIKEILEHDDVAALDAELTQAADAAVDELAESIRAVAERLETNAGYLTGDQLREAT
jgi:hypothetical protein